LHQITRDEAIGIFERLSFPDANLRLVALTLRNPARKSAPHIF
jgi:hypothetical protein